MNRYCCFLSWLILLLMAACGKKENCLANAPVSAIDKYSYPVQPGSPEWNAAGTWGIGQRDPLDSIYKLCQVPPSRLATMSTLGLIQTLEDNPCLFNMFLRTDKFQGRQEVLPRLNVSWALNKRSDAAAVIAAYYQTKDPNYAGCLNTANERGALANNWHLFDMICTQDSILGQMNKDAAKSFTKTVIEKYTIQLTYPETFGSSKTTAMLIISLVMIKQNFTPFLNELQTNTPLASFVSTGVPTAHFADLIIDFANRFVAG